MEGNEQTNVEFKYDTDDYNYFILGALLVTQEYFWRGQGNNNKVFIQNNDGSEPIITVGGQNNE